MVSLQAALSSKERPAAAAAYSNSDDYTPSSNKRKREGGEFREAPAPKELKLWSDAERTKPPPVVDLHLETPLPPEWQRCLDIQSGKIHFYNTRTHKRTSRDPRESSGEEEPATIAARPMMSLDLELNLTCEPPPPPRSLKEEEGEGEEETRRGGGGPAALSPCNSNKKGSGGTSHAPSWVSAIDADRREMVATVCVRCHMLVMMCKSSPSCPNCKFLHPPDHSLSSGLFKPRVQALVL